MRYDHLTDTDAIKDNYQYPEPAELSEMGGSFAESSSSRRYPLRDRHPPDRFGSVATFSLRGEEM